MMKAEQIRDRRSLKKWIDERPQNSRRQLAIVLGHRIALRVVPLLCQFENELPDTRIKLFQLALWSTQISRVASKRSTSEVVAAGRSALVGASKVSTGDGSVAQLAVRACLNSASASAAAAASNAADAIGSIAFDEKYAVNLHFAGFLSETAARASRTAVDAMWREIRSDAELLEQSSSESDVFARPLWSEVPHWWVRELRSFRDMVWSLGQRSKGIEIWWDWFDAISLGNPAFGIQSDNLRNALERNIALGSTDGKFNEEFWNRDPAAINADIKHWVDEARALDAMESQPRGGLLLEFLQGVLRFRKGEGLAAKSSDRRAINEQLILLRRMVDRLEVKFSDPSTLVPDDLQFALQQLQSITSRNDPASIGIAQLYTASASFRAQVNAAKSPPPGANIFPLDGANLALCESVVLTADMICLATEEGRQQFEYADTAERDAGPAEALNELEIELFTLVAENGQLMDKEDLELIRLFLRSERFSPHPLRVAYFKKEMVHSTIYAMLAGSVALGVAESAFVVLSSSTGVGLLIAAALALLGNESIKQSEYFKKLTKWNGEQIDNAIDMARGGIKGEMPAGLRKFVLQNKDLFRMIAGKRKSGEPLLTLLDYIERQEREKLGGSEKDDPKKLQ